MTNKDERRNTASLPSMHISQCDWKDGRLVVVSEHCYNQMQRSSGSNKPIVYTLSKVSGDAFKNWSRL